MSRKVPKSKYKKVTLERNGFRIIVTIPKDQTLPQQQYFCNTVTMLEFDLGSLLWKYLQPERGE